MQGRVSSRQLRRIAAPFLWPPLNTPCRTTRRRDPFHWVPDVRILHGKEAWLTVALQIQEMALRSFFDRSGGLARGTGFLSRFSCRMAGIDARLSPLHRSPSNLACAGGIPLAYCKDPRDSCSDG